MSHGRDGIGGEGSFGHAHGVGQLAGGGLGGVGDWIFEFEHAALGTDFGGGGRVVVARIVIPVIVIVTVTVTAIVIAGSFGREGGLDWELEEVERGRQLRRDVHVDASDYGVVIVIVGVGVALAVSSGDGFLDGFTFHKHTARD